MVTTLEHSPRTPVDHNRHATRSPAWAAALSLLTFTVYGFWWWWDLNHELRARGEGTHPWRALLALTAGWALIIPPFRTVEHTTAVIAAYQAQCGLVATARPRVAVRILIGFAASLVLFFTSIWFAPGFFIFGWMPPAFGMLLVWYEQRELNRAVLA